MADIKKQLRQILTPEILLAVYRMKYPYAKGDLPSGAVIGKAQFRPKYIQEFYDLVYHNVLMPMSTMPLDSLLAVDMTEFLPSPDAEDYPEKALGLITILDQQRVLTEGYGFRYMRAFFDPICEKFGRQLVSLPSDVRPDGKKAWISRGYSFDDWLIRTLWFWAPLVHSDDFMVKDRQALKDWLHAMRAEVEAHAKTSDPFAPLEEKDDVDINAFQHIETAGPPEKSYAKPSDEATISDYSFWWIRILNSHFAITDMCGHYPYWIRWKGFDWTDADKEFMKKTDNYRYDPVIEPVLQEVKEDSMKGVWKPMQPNPKLEKGRQHRSNAANGTVTAKMGKNPFVNRGMVPPQGRSMMPP